MKKIFFKVLSTQAILFLALFLSGCNLANVGPSNPSSPTSPTGDPNGPLIQVMIARESTSSTVNVSLYTNGTYTSIIDAAVTLVTPDSGSIPVPYNGSSYYDTGTGWAYDAGGTYTIQISEGGNNYSASVKAPGNITIPASGTPISWAHEGNEDTLTVTQEFGSFTASIFNADQTSPVNTSSKLTASGNYLIGVTCVELKTGPFSNAYPASSLEASDQQTATVTIP